MRHCQAGPFNGSAAEVAEQGSPHLRARIVFGCLSNLRGVKALEDFRKVVEEELHVLS